MKLLIRTDYDTYFLFSAASASTIEAFANAQKLKSEGYGASRVFIPKQDGEAIEVFLVEDSCLALPTHAESQPFVDRLLAVEKELSETRIKSYTAEQRAIKAEKAMADRDATLRTAIGVGE